MNRALLRNAGWCGNSHGLGQTSDQLRCVCEFAHGGADGAARPWKRNSAAGALRQGGITLFSSGHIIFVRHADPARACIWHEMGGLLSTLTGGQALREGNQWRCIPNERSQIDCHELGGGSPPSLISPPGFMGLRYSEDTPCVYHRWVTAGV